MKRLIFTLITVISLLTTSFAQSSINEFNDVETIDSTYNYENNTLDGGVEVSYGIFYFNGPAIVYDIQGHRLMDAYNCVDILILPTGVYIIVSSCNDFKPFKFIITH